MLITQHQDGPLQGGRVKLAGRCLLLFPVHASRLPRGISDSYSNALK